MIRKTIVMARIKGSVESGKIGNKILYTWHGRQCERTMPTHVANPQTEAQQSHRSAFAMISRLSSYMKEAHLVGLHWLSVKEKNSTYALFKHLNKDCFTSDGDIDYPRIIVSKGSVPMVDITSAIIDKGILTLTFDSRHLGGNATDEFYLFVYCPALCTGRLVEPVSRSAGKLTTELPSEWLKAAPNTQAITQSNNQAIHLYAFLRSTRGRTSDTIYRKLSV